MWNPGPAAAPAAPHPGAPPQLRPAGAARPLRPAPPAAPGAEPGPGPGVARPMRVALAPGAGQQRLGEISPHSVKAEARSARG